MFASVMVETWDQLRTLNNRLGAFVFRGQASDEWGLQSSLERIAAAGSTPSALLPNREMAILRQFQRRAHLVLSTSPALESRLEWLAILQHHGGPTRLVDFTESLYIAAFFAIDACSPNDAAVWAVNSFALLLAAGTWNDEETVDEMNQRNVRIVEDILSGQPQPPGVLHVQPERLNERMSIQKGTFLFPKDITKPFMANIAATFGTAIDALHRDPRARVTVEHLNGSIYAPDAPRVLKIILPRSIHEEILTDLQGMNISANTLFPGLDGFARSLNSLLRMPELVRQRVRNGG